MIGSGGALLNITFLFCCVYGSHLSAMIACGLAGIGASLSMTTFRGGGGSLLPDIVINFRPTGTGGFGGASLTIKGSGVDGLAGC
jgi:hypothetical protein